MKRLFGLRRMSVAVTCALAIATVAAGADRKFVTSTALQAEAQTLVNLLERAHYNRDAVRSTDFQNVIPDYMSELDGQRMFFLHTDRTKFTEEYGKSVYYNIAFLGNLDAAGAY